MTEIVNAMLSLIESTPAPASVSAPAPGPDPARARALKRCCDAWKRAFKAHMDNSDGDNEGGDRFLAAQEAGTAYCVAMPPLSGYENIRDFIACTAHGILIGAIPAQKSGQLLYAAQVALGTLHYQPKPPKSASA
ncbi:MAG: hypothetical protein ABSC88_09505 [Terracidiphilus sp.]|jgi:hypothetical protein